MNELIYLISLIEEADEDGFRVEKEVSKEVFAKVKSADYLDFYNSNNEKVKAKISFEMRYEDFMESRITKNGKHYFPDLIEWEGARYDLIRWRFTNKDKAVIVCG